LDYARRWRLGLSRREGAKYSPPVDVMPAKPTDGDFAPHRRFSLKYTSSGAVNR
jgi:hypothetical protein